MANNKNSNRKLWVGEINLYKKWFSDFGPISWIEPSNQQLSKIPQNQVWTYLEGYSFDYDCNIEFLVNGYIKSDSALSYLVATQPCEATKGSIRVILDFLLDCECEDGNDIAGQICAICDGAGFQRIDITKLAGSE